MDLDETDKRILHELLKNSRHSYRQIADDIGISTGTVLKRVQNMESQKIIQGYSANLDHKKLGYEITAIIEVTASNGKLEEVEKKIARLPNIYGVYDTTGSPDAIILGSFKDTDELGKFTKSLLGMPFVSRTNTHVVLNKIKEDSRAIV